MARLGDRQGAACGRGVFVPEPLWGSYLFHTPSLFGVLHDDGALGARGVLWIVPPVPRLAEVAGAARGGGGGRVRLLDSCTRRSAGSQVGTDGDLSLDVDTSSSRSPL